MSRHRRTSFPPRNVQRESRRPPAARACALLCLWAARSVFFGARIRSVACLLLCAPWMVAACACMSGRAHGLVAGLRSAHGRMDRLLVRRRHVCGRNLLALHKPAHLRRCPHLGCAVPHARARRDHGCVSRAPRVVRRALAARAWGAALARGCAGGVAVARMVARLVPDGVRLAIARIFSDGHRTVRLCAAARCVRHQRGVTPRRRCHRDTRAGRTDGPNLGARGIRCALAHRLGSCAHRVDPRKQQADRRRRHPGRDPAGSEMARRQSRHDLGSVPRFDGQGLGDTPHCMAGISAARPCQ